MKSPSWEVTWALMSSLGLIAALGIIELQRTRSDDLREETKTLFYRMLGPQKGTFLPVHHTLTVDGDSVTVGQAIDGRSQVLFFLTTTCPHCLRSIPQWKQVANEIASQPQVDAEVVWVFLDSSELVRSYLTRHDIKGAAITILENRVRGAFRVGAVPLTVIATDSGRIAYARPLAMETKESVDSVLSAIRHVALPTPASHDTITIVN